MFLANIFTECIFYLVLRGLAFYMEPIKLYKLNFFVSVITV